MAESSSGPNLILIGMMGTGKSTVGQLLARELNFRLLDLDERIEEREGRSIPEIFARGGEEEFRRIESRELLLALREKELVLSTGGGAVLAPGNAEAMGKGGYVAALTATAEELVSRVGQDPNRPLLAGDASERIHRLLRERAGAYGFADCTIDTTGRSAAEVRDLILMHYRGSVFKRNS
ncbi:shikimate kinase [Paenibacillus spiritus]|uniref:Shikimate kinase n=1 Tax=Paenibacillus spiritus TaxID=2496557 RepID=A0A5J5G8Z4_9BACL|nr:shikimate kinase [Paenibacillus spiritus]KAA9004014.1 shikimate kinase [Paenibacillus spiritus]